MPPCRHLPNAGLGDRSNCDDVSRFAAVTPTLRRVLHHVPRAVQVGVDDRLPAVVADVDSIHRELAAGVVDDVIQATVRLESVVHQLLDRFRFADRHGNCVDAITKLAKKLGGFGQPLLVATTDDQRGAKLCKPLQSLGRFPCPLPRQWPLAPSGGRVDTPARRRVNHRRLDQIVWCIGSWASRGRAF